MKTKKYIIFLFLGLLGCDDDFLDKTPYDAISNESIWSSDNNARMAVNGIYNALNRPNALGDFCLNFGNYGPDGMNHNGGSVEQGLSTTREGIYRNVYTDLYRVINYANDALANLPDNPDVTKELADQFIGEAHFLRGIAYFYLWQLYGGVIILDKPVFPDDTYLPRNSAEEVKQFVMNDFTDAIGLLPVMYDNVADNGRVTKGAAVAMLGKTYLYDEQWAEAAAQFEQLMGDTYAYELLDDYSHLFDFKWENNNEHIFALQQVMEPDLGSDYDMRYGGRSTNASAWNNTLTSWVTVTSYSNKDGSPIDISGMPELSDYADDYALGLDLIPWYQATFENVDERLKMNVIMPGDQFIGNENTVYVVNWPFNEHANDDPPAYRTNWPNEALFPWRKFVNVGEENQQRWDSPNNIPIIRYADVLLMYAEAKNELQGPSVEIINVVNQVRQRAGIADLSAALSQEELRRSIRVERLHELPGEGHLFFDVRRWRLAATDDPLFGLNHDVLDFRGMKIFTRVFTERDYLWPIPEQEREINTTLDQNPGWE
ncbi:MAG: RagB/SusD family nutrient uptake outer membrane protein [Cyclobacteriaceae bacterium]